MIEQRPSETLRQQMLKRAAIPVPGTPNPLFARVIEKAGFDVLYVTGAGVANMNYGLPDIGLVAITEIAQVVDAISEAVEIPIIVDADTGFGNYLNTIKTVRTLEKAGADAIQIEDQVFPKRCGHFEGKAVIPKTDMLQKIKASVDVRRSEDLLIVARTDSRAVEGFTAALERADAYAEAGADIIFLEAPTTTEELSRIPREIAVPVLANIVFGGRTPDIGQAELAEMGFSFVLYANCVLQAALKASSEVLASLRDSGSLKDASDMLASFEERQSLVNKAHWDSMEQRYASFEDSF